MSLPVSLNEKQRNLFPKITGAIFSSYDSNWIPYPFLKHSLWLRGFHVLGGLDLGSCSIILSSLMELCLDTPRERRVSIPWNTWAAWERSGNIDKQRSY